MYSSFVHLHCDILNTILVFFKFRLKDYEKIILTSPLKLETYKKIIQGEWTSTEETLHTFNKFLGILSELPACLDEKSALGDNSRPVSPNFTQTLPCIKSDKYSVMEIEQVSFFRGLFSNNQLKNSFIYLTSAINLNANDIKSNEVKKLLDICDIFFTIPITSLNLTSNEINDINKAFFKLFASITKLPKTIHTYSSNQKDLKIFELMSLSIGYFNTLSKLNANMSEEIKQSTLPYQIYLPIKRYLEGLGNLNLNFRNEYLDMYIIKVEDNAIKLVNSLTNLTTDQLSTLRYTFLNQYHNNTDLLGECKKLFNTTNCDPYQHSSQFSLISQGKTLQDGNLTGPFLKKLIFGSPYDIRSRLTNLIITVDENNPLANFLDYFNTFIKKANQKNETISTETVVNLSKLIFCSTDVLVSTQPKSKIYNSVFLLVLSLLKNPAANDQFSYVWEAIEACDYQMQNLLCNPKPGFNFSLSLLAHIFHMASIIPAISMAEKQAIANKIGELTKTCFKIESCESSSALNQFSTTLGNMVHSLSKRNQTANEKTAVQAIEKTAQQIIQIARNNSNISQSRLEGLAGNYLYGLYYNKNVKSIVRDCKKLFNLTHCPTANHAVKSDIDITTLIPETITNGIIAHPVTTVTAATTIPTAIPPHLNETVIPVNTTTEASLTTTELMNVSSLSSNQTAINVVNTNQTAINISAIENTEFSLASKIGTAMGLGALTGFLNGGSQVILHIAKQKNCSSNTQRLLAVTLAIANLFAISTLPLIYSIVENLANEEADSLMNSQKLLTSIYAFITSMVLQSLNAGVQYALAKKSILKNLFNMLPLFAGLWMLTNSEEGAIESLAILGTHILTSLAASSLTYFSLNGLVSEKNQQASDEYHVKYKTGAGECAFEIEPLNEQKETNSYNIINRIQKDSSPAEIFFEKVQFTTPEQFSNLKEYLKKIIKDVEELKDKLSDQEHSNRLEKILDIPKYEQGLRYDFMDLEAFPKKFESEYTKCLNEEQKSAVLRNNLDYFKTLIKTIYDKLLSDNVNDDCIKDILCSIETKTLKANIKVIITSIKNNLGFIRGITKPIVSIHLPQKTSVEQENLPKKGPGVLSRQDTGITHVNNNRYSIHNLNNGPRSSGDPSDSVHSDRYDNTKFNFNDPEILEKQRLLQTRLNR